jgi:hypothetical protein
MRKDAVLGRPSMIAATLGGAGGAVLAGAVLNVAPVAGARPIDLPVLLGGVITGSPAAALWVGWVSLFVVAWLIVPMALVAAWDRLPGKPVSTGGALLKGAMAGIGVWFAVGLLEPLIASLTRIDGAVSPGLFGLGAGLGAAAALLVASLGYGLVLGAIASVSRGLAPLNTLGWEGHGAGRAA